MKKLYGVLLAALVLSLVCGSAMAQTVRFEGVIPSIPVVDADGEALEEELSAETIVLLGMRDEDIVELYANEGLAYADRAALTEIIPELKSMELPLLSEIVSIEKTKDKEQIAAFQQVLIDMGYLSGTADGSFGGQSRKAVSDFQQAMGLKATGVADAVTQQLIASVNGEALVVRILQDPEELYAAIFDHCETDLTPLYDHVMAFEFDDITGKGFISNGVEVLTESDEGPDIEKYSMVVRFGFAVTDSKGVAKLTPVIRLATTSVRVPLVKDILLKAGEDRQTIKVKTTESSVEGSKSVESCTFNIGAAHAGLLANVAEAGELKMRVEGKYRSFDIEVPEDQLEAIAEIGAIAVQMLGE